MFKTVHNGSCSVLGAMSLEWLSLQEIVHSLASHNHIKFKICVDMTQI